MGGIAEAQVPVADRNIAWAICGCEDTEDGLAVLPATFEDRLEESGRLGKDSTTRRGRDPERGLALQFNRFRNPYGTEKTG